MARRLSAASENSSAVATKAFGSTQEQVRADVGRRTERTQELGRSGQ